MICFKNFIIKNLEKTLGIIDQLVMNCIVQIEHFSLRYMDLDREVVLWVFFYNAINYYQTSITASVIKMAFKLMSGYCVCFLILTLTSQNFQEKSITLELKHK